jgi:hypothetical protein
MPGGRYCFRANNALEQQDLPIPIYRWHPIVGLLDIPEDGDARVGDRVLLKLGILGKADAKPHGIKLLTGGTEE